MEDDGFIPYHEFNERCNQAWTATRYHFIDTLHSWYFDGWRGYARAYKDAKAGKTPGAKWITQFTAELLK